MYNTAQISYKEFGSHRIARVDRYAKKSISKNKFGTSTPAYDVSRTLRFPIQGNQFQFHNDDQTNVRSQKTQVTAAFAANSNKDTYQGHMDHFSNERDQEQSASMISSDDQLSIGIGIKSMTTKKPAKAIHKKTISTLKKTRVHTARVQMPPPSEQTESINKTGTSIYTYPIISDQDQSKYQSSKMQQVVSETDGRTNNLESGRNNDQSGLSPSIVSPKNQIESSVLSPQSQIQQLMLPSIVNQAREPLSSEVIANHALKKRWQEETHKIQNDGYMEFLRLNQQISAKKSIINKQFMKQIQEEGHNSQEMSFGSEEESKKVRLNNKTRQMDQMEGQVSPQLSQDSTNENTNRPPSLQIAYQTIIKREQSQSIQKQNTISKNNQIKFQSVHFGHNNDLKKDIPDLKLERSHTKHEQINTNVTLHNYKTPKNKKTSQQSKELSPMTPHTERNKRNFALPNLHGPHKSGGITESSSPMTNYESQELQSSNNIKAYQKVQNNEKKAITNINIGSPKLVERQKQIVSNRIQQLDSPKKQVQYEKKDISGDQSSNEEDYSNLKDFQKLSYHREKYLESLKQSKQRQQDTYEIERIDEFFKNNKACIIKLNYFMRDSGANQFDGFMKLSKDGQFMKIVKKLPLNNMYVKSANEQMIEIQKKQIKSARIQKNIISGCKTPGVENEQLLQQQVQDRIIDLKQSNSSFDFRDVKSFTYGPFVSRFWMMRKHMILLNDQDLEYDAPFYSWNCLTISFENKCDIYLIIKNEQVLSDFIKLLIHKTDTLDGIRASATEFKKIQLAKIRAINRGKYAMCSNAQLSEQLSTHMLQRVSTKYNIMKCRQKISFMAFQKNQTVLEFMLNAIYKSYKFFKSSEQFVPCTKKSEKTKLFELLKSSSFQNCLAQLVNYQIHLEESNQNQELGKSNVTETEQYDSNCPPESKKSLRQMSLYKKMLGSKISDLGQASQVKQGQQQKFTFADQLKIIMDKSKCFDIFQGTMVKGMKMYQTRTIKDVMFYSIQTKKLTKKINQIRLFKNIARPVLACYDNPLYILLCLDEIKFQKQHFVYQVELGEEVIIPQCLNQTDLAQSYRFYNPILKIIEDQCQDHRKNLFIERNQQLLKQAQIEMETLQKLTKLGRTDKQKVADAEQEVKYNIKDDMNANNMHLSYYRVDANEIDYLKSPHAMAIQNSKYIKIENNRERILQQHNKSCKHTVQQNEGKDGCNIKNMSLNMRFCSDYEVKQKQQTFIHFKAQFLAKHTLLLQNGELQQLLGKLMSWIGSNSEQMYKDFMNSNPTKEQLYKVYCWYSDTITERTKYKELKEMTLNQFRIALVYYTENKILKARYKQRCESHSEMYWKLTKSPSYKDMLQYFDQSIENVMRELKPSGTRDNLAKDLKRVRGQVLKNQIILQKRELKRQEEQWAKRSNTQTRRQTQFKRNTIRQSKVQSQSPTVSNALGDEE